MGKLDDKHPLDILIFILQLLVIPVILGSTLLLIYIPYKESINSSIEKSLRPLPAYAVENANNIPEYVNPNKIEKGIHLMTGLVYDENFIIVKKVCTRCHSAKIITQTKATYQGWDEMITWMQKTQGLEDLGAYRPIILNYLSKHYAPTKYSRRSNLDFEKIDWYELNE